MKKLLDVLKYIFVLAIGVLLLWLVYRNIDKENLIKGLKNANYYWVALALLIALGGHLSRGRRWALLIEPLGTKVSTWRTFLAVMFGYMANLAIPRMGEISRCVALNRTDKIPLNKLIGTVIVERGFDFISLVLITVISFAIEFKLIKVYLFQSINYLNDRYGSLFSMSTLIIVVLAIIISMIILVLIKNSERDFKKRPLYIKLREIVSGFWTGIKTIINLERKWEFVFHTLLIWSSYFLMTYLIFFAFQPTENLGPLAGLIVLTIGSLGFILPVQGGVGTYHYAAQKALEIYGISPEDGAIYALIAHSSQTLILIIVGALAFFILASIQKSVRNESLQKNKG
ncbi:MAG: flippase-like domain-containing protein [Bacteroidetes bacterium]|nr:flippase-like domain-containing protein [Bacteroidota bacterium]MBL6962809.1 flippase-like domain-containing protein [Bacteroidota bacterium]